MNDRTLAHDPTRTLSQTQVREFLWHDARLRVHAVVQGERVPDLLARLAASGREYDSLWPGALTASQQAVAPWVVRLEQGDELTSWLLFEAAESFPDWGVLALSSAPFLRVRSRLRALCKVQLPDGTQIPLAWMDPAVLAILLEGGDQQQLSELFTEIGALLLPQDGSWRREQLVDGRLKRDLLRLRKP